MVDFNKPPRQKTEEEAQFDKLNAEYSEKFGKPYVFDFAAEPMTWAEAIADIRRRIAENTPQPVPDYDGDVLY